jgi:hypothetical protein
MMDNNQSVVDFKSADNGRQRLIVLFQGGEDDILAVKFALQLARNEMVDLKVVNAGFSKEGDRESYDSQHLGFDTKVLGSRVSFIDTESATLEAVLAAVREPSSAETTVILGRGAVDMSSSFTAASSREDSRALGTLATAALFALRENALSASLMVVQARREMAETADGALRRKTTNHSDDG